MEHNRFHHHRRRMNRNDHKDWTHHDHHRPHPSASPSTELPTTSITPSSLLHQRGLTDDEIRSIFELLYYTQHENDSSNLDTTATTSTTRIDPAVNHRKVVADASTHRRSNNNSIKNRSSSIPFFYIVPCGAHCEKLSPPPYAFTNGLYVLLRPTPRTTGTTTTTYGTHKHSRHKFHKVTTATTTTTTVEKKNTTTWNEKQQTSHDSTDRKNRIQTPSRIIIPAHLQQYPIWSPTTTTTHRNTTTTANVTPDDTMPSTTTTTSGTTTSTMMIDCKWRLSGPQFPPPTAIQQRYCYPIPTSSTTPSDNSVTYQNVDGTSTTTTAAAAASAVTASSQYCDSTGGALYTMYSATTGKEILDYRLLHVYYSSKRAGNKGVVVSQRRELPSPPLTAMASTIPSSPSLTRLPWPGPNKNSNSSKSTISKRKVRRQFAILPAKDPLQSPTTTSYNNKNKNKRVQALSTPQHRRNDSFRHETSTTEKPQCKSSYVLMENHHHPYYDNELNDSRNTPSGQLHPDKFHKHQEHPHNDYNIGYSPDTIGNGYGNGGVHRSRRNECDNAYIPSSPTDDCMSTTIGVVVETPKPNRTTSNKNDWNHQTGEGNDFYQYYSQSPSPFRCPIRTAHPPINIRNISPLFSTALNATKTLDELDQYSGSNLSLSPSISSTHSSLTLLHQQEFYDSCMTHCSYQLNDDYSSDIDDCLNAKSTVIRNYNHDTILSYTNDSFIRTRSYDDFDKMIFAARNNKIVDHEDNTECTEPQNIPFYNDLFPSTISDATINGNASTILTFQSTLDYVKERIRERIMMSSSPISKSAGTSNGNNVVGSLSPMESDDDDDSLSFSSQTHLQSSVTTSLVNIVSSWAHQVAQNPLLLQQSTNM